MRAKLISKERAFEIFGDLITTSPADNSKYLYCKDGIRNKGLITFYVEGNQAYIENMISKSPLDLASWIWKCLIEAMLINMDEFNIENINIVSYSPTQQLEELLSEWHFWKDKVENNITTFIYQK